MINRLLNQQQINLPMPAAALYFKVHQPFRFRNNFN